MTELDSQEKYRNILNRIHKKISIYEGLFIIKKQYFTDNIFYYFFCVLFRFIYLISLSGNYTDFFYINKNIKSFQENLKLLTCYNFVKRINVSYRAYIFIILIILVLIIIKGIFDINIIKMLKNYKYTNKLPFPNKYQIIFDHLNFLFFPYIIDYLSFCYYIYFFPDKFVIKFGDENEIIILYIVIVVNTILIIVFNVDNVIDFVCSNRMYTISIFEADSNINESAMSKIYKPIAYRFSSLSFYIYMISQNAILFSTFEKYINKSYKIIYKIITSVLLFLGITGLFFNQINKFNYINFINTFVNVLNIFCYISIVLDLIIYLSNFKINSIVYEIFYTLTKVFLSYTAHLLLRLKTQSFLESKLPEVIFKEKSNQKLKNFINCFYYLHQIMLKIKEEKKADSAFFLVKILYKHINNCSKNICNCKLFYSFINREDDNKLKKELLKNYISELLIILNYLFECCFIDCDFYGNYELAVLLAEHFCHLKNNPIMAFSLISTLLIKQKAKFNRFQMVILYELNQKYIYYILAKEKNSIEEQIHENNVELLLYQNRREEFKDFFYNLKMANKIKNLINYYIDNEIKILKYKNIFEDSLSFKFDENNESIISIKIKFFEKKTKVENFYNESSNKKHDKRYRRNLDDNNTNLYNVINLLKDGQLYYNKIIMTINQIQISKGISFSMIFKYFLFFDIFEGGKLPDKVANKLYGCLMNKTNIYNSLITKNEYAILKSKYNDQNNRINSKSYIIVEFKKELRTKYFSEDSSLKLGFKQKDIINEKLDLMLPREFCKSHQNTIKQTIIGEQIKYSISKKSYYFDKTTTVLYPSIFEGSLIYNISKSLVMIFESMFFLDEEYSFMLNNNFELLASSRNFEDEYYLNQRILQAYNIKLLDILKIKPEKLAKQFEKEYKTIKYQKYIRQIKTQEYFIPQLYVPPEDKIVSMVSQNYFNITKNSILSKLSNNNDEFYYTQSTNDDEERKLISKEKLKNSISDIFGSPGIITFHKSFNLVLNKGIFVENLAKELIKIPENDLMFENDKYSYNLITSAKQLVEKLLTKDEIINHFMKMTIKLSFYYDKPFYFITIDDEKKVFLKISKKIHFENDKTENKEKQNKSENNKNPKKLRHKQSLLSNSSKMEKNVDKTLYKNYDNNLLLFESANAEKNRFLNKVNEYRKNINRDKFIIIIKWILSFLIICILLIYILMINYQWTLINKMEQILLAYYYNLYTKNLLLGIHSIVLQIYYESFIYSPKSIEDNPFSNDQVLFNLTSILKEKYHNFTEYFSNYNLAIGHNFDLIYKELKFLKLRGFWKEIEYESKFSSELDFIIYNILKLNINGTLNPSKADFENFLFFRGRANNKEKVYGSFIKILYYLCNNYEFVYKEIFIEIEESIYNSYKQYAFRKMIYVIIMETCGLIFYIIFFITVMLYLYFSSNIIIKNIIYLFLDFSEEKYNKNRSNNNMIILKLIEFQGIIDDFDIKSLEKYSEKLDSLNKNKFKHSINKEGINIFNTNIDTLTNHEAFKSTITGDNNNNSKKRSSINKMDNKNINMNINEKTNNDSSLKGNIFFDLKNKSLNNSSHNYLIQGNSQFLKEKLNNNSSMNDNNDILSNKSDISSNKKFKSFSTIKNRIKQNRIFNNVIENANKENDIEDHENFQYLMLNKANRASVLMIKIYSIIILFFGLMILSFIIYKFYYVYKFHNKFNRFFNDLSTLTERYMMIYYYFNNLRTLLLFPLGEKKNMIEKVMENMTQDFENQTYKFNNMLSKNMEDYKEINKLFYIIKESKNNSTNLIKESICLNEEHCMNYMESEYNIFDSGIEFAFKSCITETNNIFMDYKNLINKTNIQDINSTLIYSINSQFNNIAISLKYLYIYIQQRIFLSFEADQFRFNRIYLNVINLLNLSSIIYSIFLFLFVIIYIFISISQFTNPIKDSTYRINCSFYYIKKYTLSNR